MLLEDSFQKKIFTQFRRHMIKKESYSSQCIVAFSYPHIVVDYQKNQLKKFIPYLLAIENLASRHDMFVKKLTLLTKIYHFRLETGLM